MWRRAVTTAFVAVAALALAASAASANALSVSDRDIYFIWDELSDRLTLGGELETECNLTLLGAFSERTFTKTQGEVIGTIDHAETGACEPGPFISLEETLPWNITYESFAGVLPRITNIRLTIVRAAFLFEFGAFAECLYTTTEANPIAGEALIGAGGAVTGFDYDQDETVPIRDLAPFSFLCDGQESTADGIADVENGASADIDFALIEASPLAVLRATPESVVVEAAEASDRFTLTNDGTGTATATIDRIDLEGVDGEAPEFEVTSPGCGSTIVDGASCVYTVVVDDRPLREARVVVSYDDGVNGAVRTVSVPVEIQGEDPLLETDPSGVTIGALEHNDIFTVSNARDIAVTVTRVVVETADVEAPDFTVSSPGCRSTIGRGESCNYVISVTDRPEDDGRVSIYYRAGGDEEVLTVPVDIGGEDIPPAELRATPESVVIDRLESNDSFVIRNVGIGATTAEITRIEVITADRESPEFEVVGPGCSTMVLDEASCTYIVSVNARPQREGRITFHYLDGVGGMRTTSVRVDINS
jgi:hypothetical protein